MDPDPPIQSNAEPPLDLAKPGVTRRWLKKVTYISPEGVEINSASRMSDYHQKYQRGGPIVPNSEWEEEVIVAEDFVAQESLTKSQKQRRETELVERQERQKKVKYDVKYRGVDMLAQDVIFAIQRLLTSEAILKASIALSWNDTSPYIMLDPRRVVNGVEVIGSSSWKTERIHGFLNYGIGLLLRMRITKVSQLCLHVPSSYGEFSWAFKSLLHAACKIDLPAIEIISNMDMGRGTINLFPRALLTTGTMSLKILQVQCCGKLAFKGKKLSFPMLERVTLHGLLLDDRVCLPFFIKSCPKMKELDLDLQRNEDVDLIDASSESIERLVINLVETQQTLICRSPKLEGLHFKYSGIHDQKIAMKAPKLRELLISVTSDDSWCFPELYSLISSYERPKKGEDFDPESVCEELPLIPQLKIATILTYFGSCHPPDQQTKDEFGNRAGRILEQIREVKEIRYMPNFKEVISTCGLSLPDSAKQVAIKGDR